VPGATVQFPFPQATVLQIESARDQTGSSGDTKASAEESESGLTDDGREDRRERGEEVVGAGRPGGGRGG